MGNKRTKATEEKKEGLRRLISEYLSAQAGGDLLDEIAVEESHRASLRKVLREKARQARAAINAIVSDPESEDGPASLLHFWCLVESKNSAEKLISDISILYDRRIPEVFFDSVDWIVREAFAARDRAEERLEEAISVATSSEESSPKQ